MKSANMAYFSSLNIALTQYFSAMVGVYFVKKIVLLTYLLLKCFMAVLTFTVGSHEAFLAYTHVAFSVFHLSAQTLILAWIRKTMAT